MIAKPHGQRGCLYRVRIGDLCPGPLARHSRRVDSFGVAHDMHPRSSGWSICSHRGWSAEPVAHPPARCGERDPQRIADDHQEQGGRRWQAHRHRASWPVTVTDNGRPAAAGILRTRRITYWFTGSPATRITRGENDCQRPHGKGDSCMGDRPCMLHPARIGPRRIPGKTDGKQLLALGRNSDQHDLGAYADVSADVCNACHSSAMWVASSVSPTGSLSLVRSSPWWSIHKIELLPFLPNRFTVLCTPGPRP